MDVAIGIIPVRFGSTRFPGKPLIDLCGKPMIQWVYEQTQKSKSLEQVIVATDDERIYEAVAGFGGYALMTSKDHTCGTSRVAEVAEGLSAEIIINIQGDEPLIEPDMINQLVQGMQSDPVVYMATLKKRITNKNDVNNPHVVKVVTDRNGFALYFSRAGIPYAREGRRQEAGGRIQNTDNAGQITVAAGLVPATGRTNKQEAEDRSQSVGADLCVCPDNIPSPHWYKHVGLYGYRREFLLKINNLPYSSLEAMESLEQLRILENGYKIKVVETEYDTIGVDTHDDLVKVAGVMREIKIQDTEFRSQDSHN
ncbi:3-deoxy-manno-octulosonate cytidylyltransferase [bacterium]|nr:3-deoxy-manno-octulosonate cytidylyltransferase [bacterium]MBU1752414.1 3-deoxy-manno-octulosonate cytidylyltransferase [bacterium]